MVNIRSTYGLDDGRVGLDHVAPTDRTFRLRTLDPLLDTCVVEDVTFVATKDGPIFRTLHVYQTDRACPANTSVGVRVGRGTLRGSRGTFPATTTTTTTTTSSLEQVIVSHCLSYSFVVATALDPVQYVPLLPDVMYKFVERHDMVWCSCVR